jgi:hypothetical protein
MPRSSCTFPPSEPLDGARRCLLEESASGPLPPAVSPLEGSRSSLSAQWCYRSCLLLAAVGGAQPRGGWRSSAIARLQGFSSCSPAATSRQWPSRRMTTSLVVERSKPSCAPPRPQLQGFIILAGVEGEPSWGPTFRMGWRPASSSSIRGRRVFTSLAEEPNFGYAGSAGYRHRQLPHVWLLGLDGFGAASCRLVGAWLSVHRTGDGRIVHGSATSMVSPASPAALLQRRPGGCTRRRTPWGWRTHSWMVLSSLPWEDRSEDLFARAEAVAVAGKPPVQRWPLSSVLRWSLPLVRLSTAEVVASASETINATCRRASISLALMASLLPLVGG